MNAIDEQTLAVKALEAMRLAYAPYSRFAVGAALLCDDGQIFLGANIENGAFSPSCCAERTALYRAILSGARAFSAIAVAGGSDGDAREFCPPCGVCRQVMREFCRDDFVILLTRSDGALRRYTLGQLLPAGFAL